MLRLLDVLPSKLGNEESGAGDPSDETILDETVERLPNRGPRSGHFLGNPLLHNAFQWGEFL